MGTKLIVVAVICFTANLVLANPKGESLYSREVVAADKKTELVGNNLNYRDPRDFYNRPNDNQQPQLSFQDMLELIRRGRGWHTPAPEELYNQPPPNPQQLHHIHHHIHYSLSDLNRIWQRYNQGRLHNQDIRNFADEENKTKDENHFIDAVVFGDACPMGYNKVSDKCIKSY